MSTLLPGFQSLSNVVIRKFCTAMPTSQIIFLLTCLLLVPVLHESTLNYHKLEDTFSLAKNTTVKYYNKVKKKTTPLSENLSNTVWQIHVRPLSVNHRKVPIRKMAISFASFLSNHKIINLSDPRVQNNLVLPQISILGRKSLLPCFQPDSLLGGGEGNQAGAGPQPADPEDLTPLTLLAEKLF